MSLQVSHETLLDTPVCIGERDVHFDANGVSPELTIDEYDRLRSIPGFHPVIAAPRRRPPAAPACLPEAAPEAEEPLTDHEEDRSLLAAFLGLPPVERPAWYGALSLQNRVDLAMHPALDEAAAAELFAFEAKQRQSKRVLNGLDATLRKLRRSKDARSVTQAMLDVNYPRQEES